MFDLVAGWLDAGGPIVVLLALVSVYSIALIVMKTAQLSGALRGDAARDEAIALWREGEREEARRRVAQGRTPVDRVLSAAMDGLGGGLAEPALRPELERRGNAELEALGRNVRALEVIATVSPLLGLLGTVLGMIQSFQELELAAGAANAATLAGGIWQALLTTAMGLIVAIPAAVAASLVAARLERIGHAMEDAVGRLLAADPPDAEG